MKPFAWRFVIVFLIGLCSAFWVHANTFIAIENRLDGCFDRENPKSRIVCLQSVLEGYVRSETIPVILIAIQKNAGEVNQANIPDQLSCHDLGHLIGELAGASDEPVSALLSACANSCEYGCAHGVIAGRMRSDPEVLSHGSEICSGNDFSRIAQITCRHGVGHAFAEVAGLRMNDALARCDSLEGSDAPFECADGVFMELFDPPKRANTIVFEPGVAQSVCADIPEKFWDPCLYYTAMLTYTHRGVIQDGINVCASLTGQERVQCGRSVGSAVYAQVNGDAEVVVDTCMSAGEHAQACIEGALIQPLKVDPEGNLSRMICDEASGALAEACQAELAVLKGDFSQKNETFQSCRSESSCLMRVIAEEFRKQGTSQSSVSKISDQCVSQGEREHPSNCAYAMGRAILWVNTYWYMESLLACDRMYADFDMRHACLKGVSYENVNRNTVAKKALDPYPWENRDMHYPCDTIPETYQEPCVTEQIKLIQAVVFSQDAQKAKAFCKGYAVPSTQNACLEALE